jgi:rSAM/selenodomain-associated transferase 1
VVDLAGARVVAILSRAPSAGGKSRLFAALGRPSDPSLLAALLLDTIDAVAASPFPVVLAIEPAAACADVRRLTGAVVLAQESGTLGERMRGVMDTCFRCGAAAVALVGSDLPDLDPRVLSDAFAHLDAAPSALVLGPALDGGYYLIAATRVPDVFAGIDWGTPRVLEQTRQAAARAGMAVQCLDAAADVDRPEDLRRVRARRTRSWVAVHL